METIQLSFDSSDTSEFNVQEWSFAALMKFQRREDWNV